MNIIKPILSLAILSAGFVLVGVYGNWYVSAGVFLMLWGNNVK